MVPPLGQALAMSSREICHSYTTLNTCYKDTGLFGIYAIAPRESRRARPIARPLSTRPGVEVRTPADASLIQCGGLDPHPSRILGARRSDPSS